MWCLKSALITRKSLHNTLLGEQTKGTWLFTDLLLVTDFSSMFTFITKEWHLFSCENQEMHNCKDVQLYSFISYTGMFRSLSWPSPGCRTVRIQAIHSDYTKNAWQNPTGFPCIFYIITSVLLYSYCTISWRWSQEWLKHAGLMNKMYSWTSLQLCICWFLQENKITLMHGTE